MVEFEWDAGMNDLDASYFKLGRKLASGRDIHKSDVSEYLCRNNRQRTFNSRRAQGRRIGMPEKPLIQVLTFSK